MLLSLVLSLVLSSPAHARAIVKVDGSSTVFPITEAVSEEFQLAQKGKIRVTVGVSGTGGGFKKFCRGETDVQNASRPISLSEMENCRKAGVKYIELAIAYDAVVVVVNPKNDWVNEVSIEQLKKVWEPAAQGKLTHWNQINPAWPDEKIRLFGAGSDSGTFDFFTEAVMGKAKSSRGDYTASEDDNTLVTGVGGDRFALGYLPMAYFETNRSKLKALAVIGGEPHGPPGAKPVAKAKNAAPKKAVVPSQQSVEDSSYYLARPVFIYVSEKSLQRDEVKKFAEFYLDNSGALVPEVKYVALPAKAYQMGKEHLQKGRVGTVFDGKEAVGMKIEDLLKREASM